MNLVCCYFVLCVMSMPLVIVKNDNKSMRTKVGKDVLYR